MVDPARIKRLNDDPPHAGGRYVLYWMQQSQRTRHNPALEVAAELANAAGRAPTAVEIATRFVAATAGR